MHIVPTQTVADPLERAIALADPQKAPDVAMALLIATYQQRPRLITDDRGSWQIPPIGVLVRQYPGSWLALARYAARVGLRSHLPWWAQLGLALVEDVEAFRPWLNRSVRGWL